MVDDNLVACASKESPQDACNSKFPRKDYEGLCAQCTMRLSATDEVQRSQQEVCGLCYIVVTLMSALCYRQFLSAINVALFLDL